MGYIAINFNLVSLALVNNIISYYTAQHAQDAIVSYAGMPFGLTQVGDFMMQQADMAGFAGIIGAASIFAVTPLIFKGETAGFGAAIGGLSGLFRGNVMATASKELTDYDAQQALDRKVTTADGMTEAEAGAWLSKEGFTRPANMSAVESYNAMMKNYGAIGAADPASIMHSGNAGKFNTDNYISGSAGQSMQSMGKTAGLGANMNSGGANSASLADIGSVSIEDGEIMGSTLHNTRENRDTASNSEAGFDTGTIGAGMAAQQVAKEMASQEIGKDAGAFEKLTASARQGALEQLATGAASADKMFGNNGFGALSGTGNAHLKNVMTQAAEKISSSAGRGSTVDYDAANSKAFEDGARDGSAVNRASAHLKDVDKQGKPLYDRELAAEGQALGEMAKHAQSMGLATAVSKSLTGEKDGYADYMTGMNAQSRKSTNDAIGIGEKFGAMSDSEQIDLMKKNKENAARGFEGGIKAANAELHANGRSVDDAIADDITGAIEKGVGSSTHADNLRDKFGNDLKGKHDKGLDLAETMGAIDGAKLDSMVGQALGTLANKAVGVDYADNAMYGEMSKQQSTKAKLDAQGGVDGAVGVDVMEAGIKAGMQKGGVETQAKILEDAIATGAAKGAQTLSQAAEQVGSVQAGMQFGGSAGLLKKFNNGEQIYDALASTGKFDEKSLAGLKNEDGSFKSGGDLASWISSKQAGHMSGMHGLAIEDKNGVTQTVGLALGDEGLRVTGLDSSFKKDSSETDVSGKVTTFNNDVKKLNNTDPLATLAMTRFNGDMQKAAEYARSADGAKWMMDPRNELSVAAAEAGHQIADATGMSGEGAALLAGGISGGGVALAIANKMTKAPVQFKEAQLSKLSQVKDELGDVKGYEDSKGNKVADKDGYAVDKNGKRVQSGIVGRAYRNTKNSATSLFSAESASQPNNGSVNESDKDNNKKNNNASSNQDTPPNDVNSKDSIAKSGESSKVTGVNSKGKEYEFNPDHKTSRNAYLASNEGAHSVMHENALAHAKAQMNKPDLSAPKKNFFGRLGDAASGAHGFRGKLAAMAAVMGLGAVAGEAGTLSSAGHGATTSGGGFLQGASETLGNAEFAGGLGTMAAEAMAKYSSVAAGAAKFGARVMPGVGIAFGAADTAYRARNRLSVIQTIIEGEKHIDALKKSFQDATLQWLKNSNDEKIDEYLKRLAAKREVEENETLLKSACSTLEVPF